MKKNDMLNESTIRRFMKLATIDGLSDKFVAENLDETTEEVEEGRMRAKRDEDEMREGDEELEEMRGDKDKEEMDEAAEETVEEATEETVEEAEETVEEEVALEEEEMEMDMEMGAEEEPAAGGMVSVDQLMSALERALEDVLGQEVEVSQDGEEEMEMDMDMADAGEEMDAEEEEEDLEETTIQPDVVEEVFARVIQRLTQETKSNKE